MGNRENKLMNYLGKYYEKISETIPGRFKARRCPGKRSRPRGVSSVKISTCIQKILFLFKGTIVPHNFQQWYLTSKSEAGKSRGLQIPILVNHKSYGHDYLNLKIKETRKKAK